VNLREQNTHIDVSEYHVRKDMKNQNVRRLLAVEIHVIRVRSNVLSVTYGIKNRNRRRLEARHRQWRQCQHRLRIWVQRTTM